jgi:hypothetical protein
MPALPRLPQTAVAPSARPKVLRCAACHRVEQKPPDSIRRPVAGNWPECCGRPMVPAVPEAADRDSESAADPWADRRAAGRHPVRAGTRFEVRQDERWPDLAVALLDVSATGLQAAVRGPLSVGDRVVVWLAPPGEGWVYRGQAVVCWRADGAEGTALIGLQLRSPLPGNAVADLAGSDTR